MKKYTEEEVQKLLAYILCKLSKHYMLDDVIGNDVSHTYVKVMSLLDEPNEDDKKIKNELNEIFMNCTE